MRSLRVQPREMAASWSCATGANFPDARSGGAVMALIGGADAAHQQHHPQRTPAGFPHPERVTIDAALIFGGSGAVSNLVDGQVAAAAIAN
ncbi:MAG TPA: cell wall-binding repeat-containing protein [Jiangellaceae bacterium]|nr:cell wall-binding repeat-containing protein [Jiangellaceae bacterium]